MKRKIVISASLISAIIAGVISVEGHYSNDPYDPGGQTKYGITEKVARDFGYKGEMKDLSKAKANEIYTSLYVLEPNFDKFAPLNPAISHKLIDTGVNVGTARVSIWFQKALNAYSRDGADYPVIKEDGVLGTNSLNAYKALEKKRGRVKACTLVIKALDAYQASYYLSLTQYNRYVTGWMDKRIGNVPLDQCSEYTLSNPKELHLNAN